VRYAAQMTRFITSTVSALTVLLSAFSAHAFETPELSTAQLAALKNGEAIISVWKDSERDKKPTISVGGIDIRTSAANVFEIMLDCARAAEISKDIRACDVLDTAEDGSWDIRKQKFAIGKFLPKIKTTFRTQYTKRTNGNFIMQIEKVSGDLKVQEGRWDIISLGPDQTRVIYQAAIKPAIPIPGKVIRKQVEKGIPDVLQNLRNVAEAENSTILQNVAMPKIDDM